MCNARQPGCVGVASRSGKVDNGSCLAPKWPGRPHQISRRSPFWCSEICCMRRTFFFLLLLNFISMDQTNVAASEWRNGGRNALEISPFPSCGACVTSKQDSWCPFVEVHMDKGGRTETWLSVSGGSGSQNRPTQKRLDNDSECNPT